MSQPTAENRRLLSDYFEQNTAGARVGGKPSSEYFLDKCGSEAGASRESQQDEVPEQAARSPWRILFDGSWLERLFK